MALQKCPICELNYIKGNAQYCDVCAREMKRAARGKKQEEPEEELICTECGEAPAVHGSELCAACLREQKRQVELESASQLDDEFEQVIADEEGDPEEPEVEA